MKQLFPPQVSDQALDDDDLLDAYPWPESGTWVRAMMVTTLDGSAVGPDGRSGSISSEDDKRVFDTVRRDADVVLVGAETIRAERYTPMKAKPRDVARREAAGQSSAPVLAVVSASLDLPWALPLWSESTHRPLVLTPTRSGEAVATARQHAEVVTLAEASPHAIIDALVARGCCRIVCEGGPSLLRTLVAGGVVDEADITVAPLLTGNEASSTTSMLTEPTAYRLVQVLEGAGYLMNRYLAERS
ncbi:MAG: dihydrofolate reductase family protein [Nocardioidaceae bacterium]